MKKVKSKTILKLGFWVILISALVLSLFKFPDLENYILGILAILIIYDLGKIRARLGVRKKLTADQATNASLGNRSM